jgi:hypothetical protein
VSRNVADAANLADFPTVLDIDQAGRVLRMGRDAIKGAVKDGSLHRLTYAQAQYLFWSGELERYLRDQSGGES